jgi:hypothetical protein
MDANAKTDCETLAALLTQHQIAAVILDDDAPGVPEGTFEVLVPRADAAKADKLIARNPLPDVDEVDDVDPSSSLDLETVFRGEGGGELEALTVKGLLESNGIATVLTGDAVLPNLSFELKVPSAQADIARQIIAAAETPEA